MSEKLLKQQLAAQLKPPKASGSAAPASIAAPSFKIPVVKKGIGKVKDRIKKNHRKDRADQGLTGGAKLVPLVSRSGTVLPVSEEGVLETFDEDAQRDAEARADKNLAYYRMQSLLEARRLTKKSKMHAYKAKEQEARAKVLAALAEQQNPTPIYMKNRTKRVVHETWMGKRKGKFVAAHNPADDPDFE
ncbi:hypothetical protein GGF31_008794 [Allomyces arbusculus]|nr:hypothetical protein GGF31_008794 [Allomyces arbusculus]